MLGSTRTYSTAHAPIYHAIITLALPTMFARALQVLFPLPCLPPGIHALVRPIVPHGQTTAVVVYQRREPELPDLGPQKEGIIRPVPEYPPPRSDHFSNGP